MARPGDTQMRAVKNDAVEEGSWPKYPGRWSMLGRNWMPVTR